MAIKQSKTGVNLEYLTLKINGGFNSTELAAYAVAWLGNDMKAYYEILKIKEYSKIIKLAKKTLLDRGMGNAHYVFEDFCLDYFDPSYKGFTKDEVLENLSNHVVKLSKDKLANQKQTTKALGYDASSQWRDSLFRSVIYRLFSWVV